MFILFVFPQSTSFPFYVSWRDEINNWPALHVWVFIDQLVERCSAKAEATGSNPAESPKILYFFGLLRNRLNCCRSVTSSFQLYFRSSHHFHSLFIPAINQHNRHNHNLSTLMFIPSTTSAPAP